MVPLGFINMNDWLTYSSIDIWACKLFAKADQILEQDFDPKSRAPSITRLLAEKNVHLQMSFVFKTSHEVCKTKWFYPIWQKM